MYILQEQQEEKIKELIIIRNELYRKISKINSEICQIYEASQQSK